MEGRLIARGKPRTRAPRFLVAARGKVRADIETAPLDSVNTIFAEMKAGRVKGHMVLDLAGEESRSNAPKTHTLAESVMATA